MSDYIIMIVFYLWLAVISLLLHFNTDDGGYFLFTAVVLLIMSIRVCIEFFI